MYKERSRVGTDLCDVLVVWIKAQRKPVCICVCVTGADISSAEPAVGLAASPGGAGPEPEEGLLPVFLPYAVVTSETLRSRSRCTF